MQTKGQTRLRQARFLTELLCKNSAAYNKISLPARFWELPEWNKFYKFQIIFVNRYLDQYDFNVLVTFIKKRRIYSLAAKWIAGAIAKYDVPKEELVIVDVDKIYGSLGNVNKGDDLSYLD